MAHQRRARGTGYTPLRNVRVDPGMWEQSADATEMLGTTNSDVMRDWGLEFAITRAADPVWVEAERVAKAHGTTTIAVLIGPMHEALERYVRENPLTPESDGDAHPGEGAA